MEVKIKGNCFERNSEKFFYLADTCWSAFTNITIDEWELYLDYRKKQGFNVLQINSLPQWDRSSCKEKCYPFETEDNIVFDFDKVNEEYYRKVEKMCSMAVSKGFVLAIVVLWANYVPGTWASNMKKHNIMSKDIMKKHIERVNNIFTKYDPIYLISGDTDFDTQEAIDYYEYALNYLCEHAPNTLKTFHIKGRYDFIPKKFIEKMDFYMYQSGHNSEYKDMPYLLATKFKETYPSKPIINSEPCYDFMGYARRKYGRFNRFDVRKAAWSSILAGASAGVTYGAHGIWSWHNLGSDFGKKLGEGFDLPLTWYDALKLNGAWDYGYIKYFIEENCIYELIPIQDKIINNTDEIRIAKNKNSDLLVIYVPYNTVVRISGDMRGYKFKIIDLNTKNICYPNLNYIDNETQIEMHPFEEDVVIIANKIN